MRRFNLGDCVLSLAGCGCFTLKWYFGRYFFLVTYNNHLKHLSRWAIGDGFDYEVPKSETLCFPAKERKDFSSVEVK